MCERYHQICIFEMEFFSVNPVEISIVQTSVFWFFICLGLQGL